jgi:hypothetical protein
MRRHACRVPTLTSRSLGGGCPDGCLTAAASSSISRMLSPAASSRRCAWSITALMSADLSGSQASRMAGRKRRKSSACVGGERCG